MFISGNRYRLNLYFNKSKMKNLLVAFFMMCAFAAHAQNCQNPMAAPVFKQKLNQMAAMANDQQKLQFAKSVAAENCFMSSQVKEMALLFNGDFYRFEFCKKACRKIYDTNNIYDVYDAFTRLGNAIRLYDFLNRNQMEPVTVPEPPATWYPDLSYPTPGSYAGIRGCNLPIADNDFELLSKPVQQQQNDQMIRTEAMKLIAANCLSMGQLMKIASLFQLESARLQFLKESFTKIYDMENYSYATAVFSHIPYKNEWLSYCSGTIETPVMDPPALPVLPCTVSTKDYEDVKLSIQKVAVNSTKVTLAKQVISAKKCFTVKQIAGIIDLFAVESSRLEVALYSYDYCINTGDYYQLTESMYTTSSKDKLLAFLNSKK